MKDGGPFEKFFNTNSKIASEGNSLLKNLTRMQNDLLQKQIDLMQSTNILLKDLKDNISRPNNMISRPTSIVNNFGNDSSLRKLQGVNA
jgi:predicted PurR-regulated permease PerM